MKAPQKLLVPFACAASFAAAFGAGTLTRADDEAPHARAASLPATAPTPAPSEPLPAAELGGAVRLPDLRQPPKPKPKPKPPQQQAEAPALASAAAAPAAPTASAPAAPPAEPAPAPAPQPAPTQPSPSAPTTQDAAPASSEDEGFFQDG